MIVRDDDEWIVIAARRSYRASREPRRMFLGILGTAGLLSGLSPQFLVNGIGLVFAGCALVCAIMAVILDWRDGFGPGQIAMSLILPGVLIVAAGFLPIWLAAHYFPAHPEYYAHLFPRPAFPTPVPR